MAQKARENMPKYVSVDDLDAYMRNGSIDRKLDLNTLHRIPVADVVPVIRCAKCGKRATSECPMYENSGEISDHDWTEDDGYCSLGAAKEAAK